MFDWLTSSDDPNVVREFILSSEWSAVEQAGVFALCAAILALTVWNYRETRKLSHKVGLITLRSAILCLLLFMFFQPGIIEERVQHSRNVIAVLIDDSKSMTLPHGDTSRTERAKQFLSRSQEHFERWSEHSDVLLFRFSDALEKLDNDDPASGLSADGTSTPLLESIERVVDKLATRDLAGVVLVSDGVDTGRLSNSADQTIGLENEVRELLLSLDAPIHSFGLRDPGSTRDISIADIRYSDFAFHLNATSIDAVIRATGFEEGTRVGVSLLEDNKLVTTKQLVLTPKTLDHSLRFDIVPRHMGKRIYTVVAAPLPGEVTTDNNQRQVVVDVIRDRIRVLQICGHPSWDERFIRNHLKRDADVDLISFFILVNPRNAFALSQAQTTLIPFPAHELFVDELGGFDLVIFQDFNYGPFQTRQHLFRIRDFVREGGAFVMIGGARAFSEGGYFGTEITEVLPVELSPSTGNGETLDLNRFTPTLSEAGRRHPITRLLATPEDNLRLWRDLPQLEGVNKIRNVRSGAVTLLSHPTLRDESGEPAPVLTVGEAGAGRVMTLLTDSSWLWSFHHSGQGGTAAPYATFWDNAIRWLLRDPQLDLVRVSLDSDTVTPKQSATANVTVFGPNYAPLGDQEVQLSFTRRRESGQWGQAPDPGEKTSLRTAADGHVSAPIVPEQAGVYDVTATATVAGREVSASEVLVVRPDEPELRQTVPLVDHLQWIAQATGGQALDLTASAEELEFREPDVLTVAERRELPLWSSSEIMLLACLLFGSEWWLRRRLGYI